MKNADASIGPTGIWTGDYQPHLVSERLPLAITSTLPQFLSVIDLGCGNAAYLREFACHGKQCIGFEGHVPRNVYVAGVVEADITQPITLDTTADLVLCLEVAEHIPAEHVGGLLENIKRLMTKYLVISWAIPGQPGMGHVNCVSNETAIHMIERHCGCKFRDEWTRQLRRYLLADLPHCAWFHSSLMVFERAVP